MACRSRFRALAALLLCALAPAALPKARCLQPAEQGQEVTRAFATGPSMTQDSDGSWVQLILLHGVALPGWEGLRHAFTRQLVTVSCPNSKEIIVSGVTEVERRWYEDAENGQQQLPRTFQQACHGDASDGSDGTNSEHASSTAAAPGTTCTVTVPAVGDTKLHVRQPLQPGNEVPEPCTLTVQRALWARLLAECIAGAFILLLGPQATRSGPGAALLGILSDVYAAVAPLASAAKSVVQLVVVGVFVAFIFQFVASQLPDDEPGKEILGGSAILIVAAVIGIMICLVVLCTGLSLRSHRTRRFRSGMLRGGAPWMLAVWAGSMIHSNSEELNWTLRLLCGGYMLINYLRHRQQQQAQPGSQAAPQARQPRQQAAGAAEAQPQQRRQQQQDDDEQWKLPFEFPYRPKTDPAVRMAQQRALLQARVDMLAKKTPEQIKAEYEEYERQAREQTAGWGGKYHDD